MLNYYNSGKKTIFKNSLLISVKAQFDLGMLLGNHLITVAWVTFNGVTFNDEQTA